MGPIAMIRNGFGRLRSDESGLTVIEGMVAMLILVIGALGALQVFDASTRNTFRTEESQTLNNRLQAELEEVKRLPYAEVALTSSPGTSSDSNNPRWRVQGTKYALGRDGSAPFKEMVFDGAPIPGGTTVSGGKVDPGPDHFEIGDISGEIYRFVTWGDTSNCPGCGAGAVKRVIVAATIEQAGVTSERAFQELHADVIDPEATPVVNPAPDENDPGTTTAQFWITDTTCNNSQRQPITSDHPTHNTRGRCSNGLQTSTTRGAPDLMFIEAPALVDGQTPETQPLYDYATDVEPPGSDPDIGLQAIKPTNLTSNCLAQPVLSLVDLRKALEGLLEPLGLGTVVTETDGLLDVVTSDTNKHLRAHTWLSPPIAGSDGVLIGNGTLELFTKTVNGQSYRGEICATLFIRQPVTIPVQKCLVELLGVCVSLETENITIDADIPVVNIGALTNQDGFECAQGLNLTYFRCSKDPWPTDWSKISIPMDFVGVNAAGDLIPLVLPPDSRIGLMLMVNKSGTNGDGLEFMYDAVGFESRLELETNKILPF